MNEAHPNEHTSRGNNIIKYTAVAVAPIAKATAAWIALTVGTMGNAIAKPPEFQGVMDSVCNKQPVGNTIKHRNLERQPHCQSTEPACNMTEVRKTCDPYGYKIDQLKTVMEKRTFAMLKLATMRNKYLESLPDFKGNSNNYMNICINKVMQRWHERDSHFPKDARIEKTGSDSYRLYFHPLIVYQQTEERRMKDIKMVNALQKAVIIQLNIQYLISEQKQDRAELEKYKRMLPDQNKYIPRKKEVEQKKENPHYPAGSVLSI